MTTAEHIAREWESVTITDEDRLEALYRVAATKETGEAVDWATLPVGVRAAARDLLRQAVKS